MSCKRSRAVAAPLRSSSSGNRDVLPDTTPSSAGRIMKEKFISFLSITFHQEGWRAGEAQRTRGCVYRGHRCPVSRVEPLVKEEF